MNNLSIKDTLKYAMAMSIITITHEETINPDMCHNSVENFVKNNKWVEKKLILNGDVALRINPTIYCINFYFLKQYIVYKSFSATAPFFFFFFF